MIGSTTRRTFLLPLIFLWCCGIRGESEAKQATAAAGSGDVESSLKLSSTHAPEGPRKPGDLWVPPDIDEFIPPVDGNATCSLPDVLMKAGERLEELTHNLERFRATETIQHEEVDRSGRLHHREVDTFDYLVFITSMENGLLNVEEYRKGYSSSDQFPDHVETKGVPILVFAFYPPYATNFDMYCEGLGRWRGQPAWQIHFQERTDGAHHMCGMEIGGRFFVVPLRGRAWILADSYQVARLETDLEETIPKIRLRLQHEDIEYKPVYFTDSKVEMWLPSSADLYMDFIGHRFYRRHSFTDFQLFSVTTHQEIGQPKRSSREK